MITLAVKSPATFTDVRHISRIRSTPSISPTATGFNPIPVRIVARTTIPPTGVSGIPIDAQTEFKITHHVDTDHLKLFNDYFGLAVGDQIIQQISDKLNSIF